MEIGTGRVYGRWCQPDPLISVRVVSLGGSLLLTRLYNPLSPLRVKGAWQYQDLSQGLQELTIMLSRMLQLS